MFIRRRSRLRSTQRKQLYFRSCSLRCCPAHPFPTCSSAARRRRASAEDTKRVQKCTLLHPRWFHRRRRNSFGMNGGDDETRTRDLCRDRHLDLEFQTLTRNAKEHEILQNHRREFLLFPDCSFEPKRRNPKPNQRTDWHRRKSVSRNHVNCFSALKSGAEGGI